MRRKRTSRELEMDEEEEEEEERGVYRYQTLKSDARQTFTRSF